MRWNRSHAARLMLGTMLSLSTTMALADVMILRATGPSSARYVAGRTLPDTARITLQANDQLVLLDVHGTRTLQGPGGFVAGAAVETSTSLTSLASAHAERRARIGAVRNETVDAGPPRRPNIWFVDTAKPGPACVADPAGVILWRSDSEHAGTTTITGGGGATAKLDWIKGQTTQPWPSAIPVAADADYRLAGEGAMPAGTVIRFQLLQSPPADLQALAGTLVTHGCQGQLDVLIATTTTRGA